jgi:hypothetical protein
MHILPFVVLKMIQRFHFKLYLLLCDLRVQREYAYSRPLRINPPNAGIGCIMSLFKLPFDTKIFTLFLT